MKSKYLVIMLLMAVLVLGCASKETQPIVSESVKEQASESGIGSAPKTSVDVVPEKETTTSTTVSSSEGVILIADTENHRVMEVDKNSKEVLWQYGCEEVYPNGRCSYGIDSNELYQPMSASYDRGYVLIADKSNDRVIEVGKNNQIVWTFSDVRDPSSAAVTAAGNILIADTTNNRVIEVNSAGEILWEYGCSKLTAAQKCAPGSGDNMLNIPSSAVELDNGNILIADKGNNRVLEVTKEKETVFEFKDGLNSPLSAQPYGDNYVIANANKNNVIVIDSNGEFVKEIAGMNHPSYAEASGNNILITDSFNNRIIETDADGSILWFYGDCDVIDGNVENACALGAGNSQVFKASTAVSK